MDKELTTQIRNKLQTPKIALDLLFQGEDMSKKFIKRAWKDLNEAKELLKGFIEGK